MCSMAARWLGGRQHRWQTHAVFSSPESDLQLVVRQDERRLEEDVLHQHHRLDALGSVLLTSHHTSRQIERGIQFIPAIGGSELWSPQPMRSKVLYLNMASPLTCSRLRFSTSFLAW